MLCLQNHILRSISTHTPLRWRFVVVLVSWLVKVNGFRVDWQKFNLHREFVHEDRLTAHELVEGTNAGEDVENGVVVFNAVVGDEREGDVAVVSVDSFVPLGGF